MTSRGLDIIRKPVDGAQEPVEMDDFKSFLSLDYDDQNGLINTILVGARQEVEAYTGLSLIKSNVKARWEALTTQELPYGPVQSITTVKDKDGTAITSHEIEGLIGSFPKIKADSESPVVVEYEAGYEIEIPEILRLCIMKLACDHFTFRTIIDPEGKADTALLPNNWKTAAGKFSRKSW